LYGDFQLIAKRLSIDCKVISNNFTAIPQRLRSDFTAIKILQQVGNDLKGLRSDPAAISH
jgi:hypothetical protein